MNRTTRARNVFLAMLCAAVWGSAATITVDFDSTGQTIDGFGGFGAKKVWWGGGPYYDNAFLDLIFEEVGMTMIRTEFYPRPDQEDNFTRQIPYLKAIRDYTDARGIELKVIATVWTPPARFKDNNNTAGGTLKASAVDSYASYLIDYIKYFRQQTGYDLYAISPANEPQAEHFFNSCAYVETLLADVVKSLAHKLVAERLPTKIFYSDDLKMHHMYHMNVWNAVKTDPVADSVASIHCQHYGDENPANYQPYGGVANVSGGKAWNTEFGNGPDTWDHAWTNAVATYQMLRYNYSAVVYWLIGPHSNSSQSNESLMYDLQMGPKSYGAKAFFKYLRPGAVRTGCGIDDSQIGVVSFRHDGDRTVTVILLNRGSSSKTVTVSDVAGLPDQWDVYRTGSGSNCEKVGTVAPGGSVTIPAQNIVTLYNTGDHPATYSISKAAPREPRLTVRRAVEVRDAVLMTPDGRRVANRARAGLAPGVYLASPRRGTASVTRAIVHMR